MSYFRVQLRGNFGSSGEVWSVNPAFNNSVNLGWDQAKGQAAADAIAALTPGNGLQTLLSPSAQMSRVRVELRSDAHELIGAAEAVYTGTPAPSTGAALPPQSAVVISLRSLVPGSRGRGRLYWPAIGAALHQNSYRLTLPTAAQVNTAAVVYLTNIQDALRAEFIGPGLGTVQLCVVSRTTGTRTDVTSLQVGDVIDTQRRRRDNLAETYNQLDFPVA